MKLLMIAISETITPSIQIVNSDFKFNEEPANIIYRLDD